MRRVKRFGDMTTKTELTAFRDGVKVTKALYADINRLSRLMTMTGITDNRNEFDRLTAIYREYADRYSVKKIKQLTAGADLSAKERLIFELFYGDAMPVSELSDKYFYSERMIYYNLKRARAKLHIMEV